ncbi:zinc-binding dehydrogenase [Demequina lignilytica]|uniref:Zinc-binding dehydrogenase n=1 Tax=Demequina lignilytica TaxID=3051663 RepID=A0AB35MEN7_9MICO|nr:zinc-binding dehydrogenase [Demequina sp. SYSU T0a273]MDN4482227.1 zinc-binding dehydrogenase [Demequina sp. SYSU T0a273]
MRALLLEAPGDPSGLRLGEIEPPALDPGAVLIAVEACGLNPVDASTARSGHPAWTYPHVPGLDIVGRVEAVGEAVGHLSPGDRVAVHTDLRRGGGLGELAAVDARAVALVPEGLGPVEAAALPCAGLTALQAVARRLDVEPGDTVLVTGGSGGVGGFAVQLAVLAGARVIATASAAHHEAVRELGAHDVIDYRSEDVAARVRELTGGRGVDAVVDTVSARSATENLSLLAHGGGIACVAGRADLSAVPPFTTAPSVHEIALGAAHAADDERSVAWLAEGLELLMDLVVAEELDPLVTATVTLAEAPAALARVGERHTRGKVVAVLAER